MRTNELDVHHSDLKRNSNNESVIVAFDVEYDASFFENTGTRKPRLDIGWLLPLLRGNLIMPSPQLLLNLWISFPISP